MSNHNLHRATPLSRIKIANSAQLTREVTDVAVDENFNVVVWLENKLCPTIHFDLHIGTITEMGENEGLTFPENRRIYIREDVYEAAYLGSPRDRFTVVHEAGHALYHTPDNIVHSRNKSEIKSYECPEWQANTFAAEFLVPRMLVQPNMTPSDISNVFNVSREVADIQYRQYLKAGIIKEKADQFVF